VPFSEHLTGSYRIAIGLAVVAIVVAIIALDSGSGGGGDGAPDRYTLVANRLCRTARQEIAQARRRYRDAFESGNTNPLARSMFTAVGHLQDRLGRLNALHDHSVRALELHEAVFAWEYPIIDLIQISTSARQRVRRDARKLESISSTVHDRASALNLDECARLHLGLPRLSGALL
jgi:hypothetical protein